MTNIIWDNVWNTNNETIDQQHHELVDIVNSMKIENNNILEIMESLINYSAVHFADEEGLMLSNDYIETEYTDHKLEHRLLKHALLDFSFLLSYMMGDDKKFKLQIRVFKAFVTIWFKYHFLLNDKKFADWLQAKGGANTSS